MSFKTFLLTTSRRSLLSQQQRCVSISHQVPHGKIGVIGLGNMGLSMAQNVLKSEEIKKRSDVVVYDINSSAVTTMEALGATGAKSVAELAKECHVIITMLPATKHVQQTLLGPDGVFQNAPKGSLIIDSSTIDPIASQEMSKVAASLGHYMIDAPVSGGVTGAAAGTLTFMVGGQKDALEKARPILEAMGKNIIHCGGPGAGGKIVCTNVLLHCIKTNTTRCGNPGVTKLCNNLSLAISMIGTSEAMALGVRMGLDPKTLAGVMNTSTARCWSSDSYNPVPGVMPHVPASNGYKGGFGTALMEKDLTLALDMASTIKARLPLGGQAHQMYGLLCESGYGGRDFAVIYEYLTQHLKDKEGKQH
eukprot:scaffold3266_cov236-Ochromonas_danica.AAC.4